MSVYGESSVHFSTRYNALYCIQNNYCLGSFLHRVFTMPHGLHSLSRYPCLPACLSLELNTESDHQVNDEEDCGERSE